MTKTDANALEGLAAQSPTALAAKKTRRQIPQSTRRIVLIVAGVFVLLASVGGFYFTADAFEQRVPVMVAAVDIVPGETVTAASLTAELVVIGSIPHQPWTPTAPFAFEGMVAVQPIPAGALLRTDMFILPDTQPVGVQFQVVVPLDASLDPRGVSDGDTVLMIDPGVSPSLIDPGRPRQVIHRLELRNFDGSQMTLFVSPEEWAEWTSLLERLGATPLVMAVPIGADPDEMTQRVDAVWHKRWSDSVAALEAAMAMVLGPVAGPGELEVFVPLDGSLVPSEASEGDLVLLVDPGAAPDGNDPGRPRAVLQELLLQNYAGGNMQMFLPPEEWVHWRSLPEELGAAPMIIPVPPGTDLNNMASRLNAEWERLWRNAVQEALTAS